MGSAIPADTPSGSARTNECGLINCTISVPRNKCRSARRKREKEQNCLIPLREQGTILSMRIISRKTLREFWDRNPDARQPLQAWCDDAKQAEWRTPNDIKNFCRNASFLANNRVVFNIKGNSYRLIVTVQYAHGILYIRFIGTHRDHDHIDAATGGAESILWK